MLFSFDFIHIDYSEASNDFHIKSTLITILWILYGGWFTAQLVIIIMLKNRMLYFHLILYIYIDYSGASNYLHIKSTLITIYEFNMVYGSLLNKYGYYMENVKIMLK